MLTIFTHKAEFDCISNPKDGSIFINWFEKIVDKDSSVIFRTDFAFQVLKAHRI